ncbi:Antitoxin to RelE-like translational repressor toxin [hydrothermal vent metagenome]|uniref:Antitoxin to RelE-like translational repressor toxin n=1 Tax=hydrothermal vent metagenome TaxID=652676 RepID=A0A3B1DCB8_9ZZZZ
MLMTIIELPEFIKRSEKILTKEEKDALLFFLSSRPEAGNLIQGTGGIRKLRWGSKGKGKSEGSRAICFYYNQNIPLFLLTIFDKNEKVNLSKSERNNLFKLTKQLLGDDMNKIFNSIDKGLQEAIHYSKGKKIGAKKYIPHHINVKKLRSRIGMTQTEFAESFGISLGTLRHWERGDRYPQGPALILLNLLEKDSEAILNVLHN